MDIFNRKRVKMLEIEKEDLKRELNNLENALKTVVNATSTIPEDCKSGSYCKACKFAKPYHYTSYVYPSRIKSITGYTCGKGELCSNFIQKEYDE